MVKMVSKGNPKRPAALVYQPPPQAANSSSSFLAAVSGEATPSFRITLLQWRRRRSTLWLASTNMLAGSTSFGMRAGCFFGDLASTR